jgi:hypothetical protein
MTQLGSIINNHLSLTCKVCSYHTLLPVRVLIDKVGWKARLQDVVSRLACSRCKAKGAVEFQILFVGGSGEAMLAAKVVKDPKSDGRVEGC